MKNIPPAAYEAEATTSATYWIHGRELAFEVLKVMAWVLRVIRLSRLNLGFRTAAEYSGDL